MEKIFTLIKGGDVYCPGTLKPGIDVIIIISDRVKLMNMYLIVGCDT